MDNEIKVSKWDAVEYLETQEDIDMLMEVAFESGDNKHILRVLGHVARAQGILDIANKTGLAREHIYNSLSGNGNPTLNTLTAIIDTMGYRLAIVPKNRDEAKVH